MVNRLRFIPTSEEIPAVRQLLDQHLIELESHSRELIVMNAKLRKDNEAMRALLASVNRQTSYTGVCPVCRALDDCEPSCDGLRIAAMFD